MFGASPCIKYIHTLSLKQSETKELMKVTRMGRGEVEDGQIHGDGRRLDFGW